MMLNLNAQSIDPYIHFERIQQAYAGEALLRFDVVIRHDGKIATQQAKEELRMTINQKGGEYYIKTDDADLLHQDGHLVLVSHGDQQILYQQVESSNQFGHYTGIDLRAIQQFGKENGLQLKAFEVSDQLAGLRFDAPDHSDTTLELIYEKKTHLLREVEFNIQVQDDFAPYIAGMQHQQFTVTYSNYQQTNQPLPRVLEDYVYITNQGVAPHPKYQTYECFIQ